MRRWIRRFLASQYLDWLIVAFVAVMALLAAANARAFCPVFGSYDHAENLACLVAEYQGYADARTRDGEIIVVLPEGEALSECTNLVGGGPGCVIHAPDLGLCVIVLPAPYSNDMISAARELCDS